ncbi:MAG: 5'-nucleotidase C-terminal domain-containing protein [Blastocatellia bacterium]
MQSQSNCTPIFKMGSDARTLGRIDLNISKATRRIDSIDYAALPVDESVPSEPLAAAIIGEFEKKLSAELDKPVGNTSVELDAKQITSRSVETNLGDFITDAFRAAVGADVTILNGGSIRSNTTYGPGALTKRDVLSILPFENLIVKVEVKGATLRQALEHGVSKIAIETEVGAFPQVSGMSYSYDTRKPPGARLVEVKVNGQPLDDNKTYTLASGAYLLKGGDGYTMLKGLKYLIAEENAKVDAVIVSEAITVAGTIAPKTEGRIRRVDQ